MQDRKIDKELVRAAETLIGLSVDFYDKAVAISNLEGEEWIEETFVNFDEKLDEFFKKEFEELKTGLKALYPSKEDKLIENSCLYAFVQKKEDLRRAYERVWHRRMKIIAQRVIA